MRILVTGGAGYIGSHAVRALLDRGHEVVVLDNLTTGHRAAVDPRATFLQGDLRDREAVHRAMAGSDAVLHFAALSVVGDSVANPLAYWENNVIGSLTLLAAMQHLDVRALIFSSTAATYGIPETLPIVEETPQRPINPYGSTKLAVETAIRETCASGRLSAVILRYFNVAGASSRGDLGEDHEPETHLVPIVLQAAAGRRDGVAVFGTDYPTPDGTCIRDFVHVEDLVDAHVAALDALSPGACRVYNVGIGRGYSVREILETARKVTGVDFPVRIAERRAGDPPVLYTDPSRLKRELGWEPRFVEPADMIASAWRWMRAGSPSRPSRG